MHRQITSITLQVKQRCFVWFLFFVKINRITYDSHAAHAMAIAYVSVLVLVHVHIMLKHTSCKRPVPRRGSCFRDVIAYCGCSPTCEYEQFGGWMCFCCAQKHFGCRILFRMCKRVGCVPANHDERFHFVMNILFVLNALSTFPLFLSAFNKERQTI